MLETSNQDRSRLLMIDTESSAANVEQVLKALASDRRLEILRYLGGHVCSVNEIADALDMPTSTATMHINMLEKAGLIRTELTPASRGLQKVCVRLFDRIVVTLPEGERHTGNTIDISMPIGTYVDCQVVPTCGILSETGIIGHLDDPTAFYDPERVQAQHLWFKQGFVEYRFPNRVPRSATVESLQISVEIASEAPLYNEDWPSDITTWVNGVEIATWTCPGDFGGERGALTPEWWEEWNSQYGLLKVWKVTEQGTQVDGVRLSNVVLDDLNLRSSSFISVRFGIKSDAVNVGGLNLFGRRFGNYPQDIVMRIRYR